MSVFLSFHKSRSHRLATIFHSLLKRTLVGTDLFLSSEDIPKGADWWQFLRSTLVSSRYGLVFLTKEAAASPWVHFEAGVIAGQKDSKVVVINVDFEEEPVPAPLNAFQQVNLQGLEIRKLIFEMNDALPKKVNNEVLGQLFQDAWNRLNVEVTGAASAGRPTSEPTRTLEMFGSITSGLRRIEAELTRMRLGDENWRGTVTGTPSAYAVDPTRDELQRELQRLASYELSGRRLELLRFLLAEPPAPEEDQTIYMVMDRLTSEIRLAQQAVAEAERDRERSRRDAMPPT